VHFGITPKNFMKTGRDLTADLRRPVMDFAATDVVTLLDSLTVDEALGRLRSRKLGEKIVYFYVVDAEQRLVGVLPVRRLLMSPLDEPVAALMLINVHSLRDTATLGEASEVLLQHRLMALPVVDDAHRLIGVFDITVFSSELSEVAHQHEIDNAFQLAGVHAELGRNVSWWSSYRDRFSWLIANIIGGIICAIIVASNEALIETATMLAFFIPMMLSISESVSMQSMTLTLQTSTAAVSWSMLFRAVRRELPTAFGLGISSAVIVVVISLIWKGQLLASLAVGIAIIGAVLLASALGVILPAAVRALRADPKVASGPIALALADIIALLLLFGMAQSFLG
jgi:magnesium transporter